MMQRPKRRGKRKVHSTYGENTWATHLIGTENIYTVRKIYSTENIYTDLTYSSLQTLQS